MSEPASLRAGSRLPPWMGSIRVRIAVIYSTILFGLAGLVVFGIYMALARALGDEPVYRQYVTRPIPGGVQIEQQDFRTLESVVNAETLDRLRAYSFGALLVLFVGSIVVGWFVAGRVLRPIGDITEVARDIQATDMNRRIDLQGPDDELKDLADTFDEMLDRLDDAFENQRLFIQEASHELRNPLAVIRTNLDVTLADEGATAQELRHTAEVVQKSSERMTRLVDDLLVYARRGQLSVSHEPLDAAEVAREAAEEFRVTAEAAEVHLGCQAQPGLVVVGDRLALGQAMANLLANAMRVSKPGDEIEVTAGRDGAWVWMAVTDGGPGIAPGDQAQVFQRFWRGDQRAGREEGRSGLGLTIVRQIAEAHGGEVRLRSALGEGAAFAIWLPAAG